MYTILLVDDEISVIESLKNDIPWGNLGVETILTASDGEQALLNIHNTHVDLLITDIRMPHMDGISLLKILRREYPDMHCIFLTAYGEFDYAMQALRLGVDNYLMKPVQVQELLETVEITLDNIYANRKNREILFQENILRRWLSGMISSDELAEKTIYININIYQSNYCVVAMRKKADSISLIAYGQEFLRRLPPTLEGTSLWDNSNHFILLIGGREICPEAVSCLLMECSDSFQSHGLTDIAIGPVVRGREELNISYHTACNAIDKGICKGKIHTCSADGQVILSSAAEIDTENLSPIVERAIQYMKEHYGEGISIKSFCAIMNINSAYLGYLFKKETGMFFNNYLLDLRMEKAVDLLCHTGEKIGDIAEKTGYVSTSHFISNFRKKTGLSPLKYREIHGGRAVSQDSNTD